MPAPDPSARVPKLLVPYSSCTHTASNSPAPALQTPHYTLNHTCPVSSYTPVVLMHPKHTRFQYLQTPILPLSLPHTSNTHSQTPALTGSPGIVKGPVHGPGPGPRKVPGSPGPAPPHHEPLPLRKTG